MAKKPLSENKRIEYRELHQSLAAQVRSEIAEYHRIHAFFIVVLAAIVGLAEALDKPDSILYIGIAASLAWLIAHRSAVSWRDWWINKAAEVEKSLWEEKSELSVFSAALNRDSEFDWLNLRTYGVNLMDITFALLPIISFLSFVAWAAIE